MDQLKSQGWLALVALQEAFVSMAPYLIIISLIVLLVQIASVAGIDPEYLAFFQTYTDVIYSFLEIVMLIAMSYHFALRFHVDRMNAIILSLFTYLTIVTLLHPQADILSSGNSYGMLLGLFVPITSVLIFAALKRKNDLQLSTINVLNIRVYHVFSAFPAMLMTYAIVVLLFWLLSQIPITPISRQLFAKPSYALFMLRVLLVQIAWAIGIHGSRLINSFTGIQWLTANLFPNLSYLQFYRLFANIGGSGVGLALFADLLFINKDEETKRLLKFSWPFIPFNINSLLIYGLPVAFNRTLLLPFITIPLVNLLIAYGVLQFVPVTFTPQTIPWTTPVLLNGYLASNGSLTIVGLQLFLLVMDALLYIPFVRKHCASRSMIMRITKLEQSLDLVLDLETKQGLAAFQAQRFIVDASFKVDRFLDLLQRSTLLVYYQPKVNLRHPHHRACEALLRLRTPDGRIRSPFFMEELEAAGMAAMLDIWVCKQVSQDIAHWHANGLEISVSINLHPDTLQNAGAVRQIAAIFKDEEVEFEIVERSLLKHSKEVCERLQMLNHRLAIDDFGTGYSNPILLADFPVKTVKLDRSLLIGYQNSKRALLYKELVSMCKSLGTTVVAEGVETEQELRFVAEAGVDCVQGFYFAPALPRQEFERFAKEGPALPPTVSHP